MARIHNISFACCLAFATLFSVFLRFAHDHEDQTSVVSRHGNYTSMGSTRTCKKTFKRVWLYGAHHKSGTELFRRFAKHHSSIIGQSSCVGNTCDRHILACNREVKHHQTQPSKRRPIYPDPRNVFFHCHLTVKQLANLESISRGSYRVVHVIRDPVEVVVSGYVYHLQSRDLNGQTPLIRHMNLSSGIDTEADYALKRTLKDMAEVVRWSQGNPRALVLRLEDFDENFNLTARRMYSHMGADIFCERQITQLLERAAVDDIPWDQSSSARLHFSDAKLKNEARTALRALPERWSQLQLLRGQLGYS